MKYPFVIADKPTVMERLGNLDWQAIGEFINSKKPGTRMVLEIKGESKPKSKGQLGYYYGVILPRATEGMQADGSTLVEMYITSKKGGNKKVKLPITKDGVDMLLKLVCAQSKGIYMDKGEMDMDACRQFEDYCIRWLCEHKDIFIPPADIDWRNNGL